MNAQVVRRDRGRLHLHFTDRAMQRDALIRKLFTGPQALPGDTLNPARALTAVVRRGFLSPV